MVFLSFPDLFVKLAKLRKLKVCQGMCGKIVPGLSGSVGWILVGPMTAWLL